MNKYLQSAKKFLKDLFAKEATIGILVMVGVIAIVVLIVLFIQAAQPKIVYQPAVACDLLTQEGAKQMLGDEILHQAPSSPTLQNNVATSKCSYTDRNPDENQMKVAAIAVRSGVTDEGVTKNKHEFAAAKLNQGMQPVSAIGESAFFNPELGQLNILKGNDWIILSYGIGTEPKSNTLQNAIELSQKVIASAPLPTF